MKKRETGGLAPPKNEKVLNNRMDGIGNKGFSDNAAAAVLRWFVSRGA